MQNSAIEIFEACNFQDLTSPHLAKVLRRSTISRNRQCASSTRLIPLMPAPRCTARVLTAIAGRFRKAASTRCFAEQVAALERLTAAAGISATR